MKKLWSTDDIPLQAGRIAVVTGANSGLGYHTARALALKGSRVIMACRSLEKGEVARQQILALNPEVEPEVWHLDLASLKSVRAFAEKFNAASESLDLLINNAGLMAIPYGKTEEGFEMQFGVNHLGHFVLSEQHSGMGTIVPNRPCHQLGTFPGPARLPEQLVNFYAD